MSYKIDVGIKLTLQYGAKLTHDIVTHDIVIHLVPFTTTSGYKGTVFLLNLVITS